MFEIDSKASHRVSNNFKKNIFLIVSYFLGPNERAWTEAGDFPSSLPSIKEMESRSSKLIILQFLVWNLMSSMYILACLELEIFVCLCIFPQRNCVFSGCFVENHSQLFVFFSKWAEFPPWGALFFLTYPNGHLARFLIA